MPTKTWNSIKGRRLRATKLDECGAVAYGACASYITKGFISVQYSPEIEEGEEYTQKLADGSLAVDERDADAIKWFELEIVMSGVEPDLVAFLTGQPMVLDYAGAAVGNRFNGAPLASNVAIEVWSDIPNQACVAGDKVYGYFLTPWLSSGSIDAFTLENGVASFTLKARTKKGSLWDEGPYDVDGADVANTPGPLLTPIGATEMLDMHLTVIPPPAVPVTPGCTTLVAP
jgi:hypothetical protein